MAASAHLKTQSQPQPHRSKRRKRRETTISVSSTPSLSPHVVSSDGSAWCCSVSSKAHHHQPTPSFASPPHPRRPSPPPPLEPDPAFAEESSHSPSPAQVSPGCASPGTAMDGSPAAAPAPAPAAAFPVYHPSSYSKFNSALNAGLLNPMSPPPLDKTRSSPTLFDMMTNEHDYHPRPALPQHPPPASRAVPVQNRQLLLQERIADILGSCSPGSQFNDPDSGDVLLTLSSKDGFSVSLNVHRHILVTHSRFFAAKLSDRWSRQQRSLPHLVEISDCDDVDVYIETLRLMYCKDIRRRLMKEDVSKVLGILKVPPSIL